MKIKNKIIGVLGALSIVFCSVCASVSAGTNFAIVNQDFSVPEFHNPQDLDVDFLRQLDDAVYLNTSLRNQNITKQNSFWVIYQYTGTYYLQVIEIQPRVEVGSHTVAYRWSDLVSFSTTSFIDSYVFNFGQFWYTTSTSFTFTNVFYMNGRTLCIGNFDNVGNGWDAIITNFSPRFEDVGCVRNYNFPYDPILSPILDYPYNLDIQSQDFVEWLISTGKYTEINDAILSNHVSGFVDIFRQYGGSSSFFKRYCKGFFDFNNIGQGVSDYNLILKKTKALYQEYLRLKNDTVGNHLAPRVESTIVPETNDSNTVLVTNAVDDTTIISLLRDILRSLIALPNTLNDLTQLILNKLDSLDLTTNIVNDGGSGITDFSDLYIYDVDVFNNDLADFETDIEDVQSVPMGYISTINQNRLMPENMLEDKNSLTVNVPTITGFTVGGNGSTYSTQTGSYVLRSVDYPWLDTVAQKIKRFGSIILIIGYLVHLRYRIPELIRGE